MGRDHMEDIEDSSRLWEQRPQSCPISAAPGFDGAWDKRQAGPLSTAFIEEPTAIIKWMLLWTTISG
jgi:hypothetical protein